jgi:hypothetical protein
MNPRLSQPTSLSIPPGLPGGTAVTVFAIDPSTPRTLYALAFNNDNPENRGVFKSTDGGGSWSAINAGLPLPSESHIGVTALAIDPTMPSTLYAGTRGVDGLAGVFKSTDSGGSWNSLNTGLTLGVSALAIDPSTPGTLYAATYDGGVFGIEQVGACVGDCGGTGTVAINDLITLVNIALGTPPSACPHGVPSGGEVNIALIIKAVNNALKGCGG